MREQLEESGIVWFRRALDKAQLASIERHLAFGARPGFRPQVTPELIALLGKDSALGALSEQVLPHAKPVRVVAFNKTPQSNWAVPWHQDRVIAVREKHEVAGFENWSHRDGYWHVEPPASLLDAMIFARVCFDRSSAENGAMQLAVATHAQGRVADSRVGRVSDAGEIHHCEAEPGDVLFVKALTLHRSASATTATQRRALRVDYSAEELPHPLRWALP